MGHQRYDGEKLNSSVVDRHVMELEEDTGAGGVRNVALSISSHVQTQ